MGRRKFDVGIVVPLKEEFRHVVEVAPQLESIPHEGTYFYRLDFGAASVICCLARQMGPLPAQHAAIHLLGFAEVKLLVVLGLGGALDDDVAVGDVVVATEVNEFQANSKAEAVGEGYKVLYSGRHWPLEFRIREAINNFEFAGRAAFIDWQEHASGDYDELDIPNKESICSSPPSLHLGPIASGNVVSAASDYVEEVKSIDRKFVAIDMEAAGVAFAAAERIHPVPCLVVRGISDHANEGKKTLDDQGRGAWRRYCVRSATSFLRNLLTWEGFLNASGICTPSPPSGSENLERKLVAPLSSCVGGPWIVGVAFGLYSHGPRITDGEAVVPLDLSRLRVLDKRIGALVDAATELKEELLARGDVQTTADGFARLVGDFRNQLGSAAATSLLQDFDKVVMATLCPESENEQMETILLEADRLEEEVGPEAVVELLSELVSGEPRLRERYVSALACVERWPEIVESVSNVENDQLSRRELEQVLIAYAKTGLLEAAIETMTRHQTKYDDNGARLFRREVSRQHPELDRDRSVGES